MSCYRPTFGIYHGQHNDNGKKVFEFMSCEGHDWSSVKAMFPGSVLLPCGKCIGCRLDHSRRWADRMLLELVAQDYKGVFVTLTYNDDHLVDSDGNLISRGYGSLYKKHFQDWLKRLRKELMKSGIQIKFYACGEYGSWNNTHRPHYHCILFGCCLSDFGNCRVAQRNELGQCVYETDLTNRTWSFGFSSVGDVSWSTCAYVARYVQKKAYDPTLDLLNESLHLNPEFSLMSRRPGLGASYLLAHPDCLELAHVSVPTQDGHIDIPIPKYFINQLPDSDFHDKILYDRQRFADDRLLSQFQNTDLNLLEYLGNCESKKLKVSKSLKRSI